MWVVGANLTADRLRAAFTTRRGYVLSPLGCWLTIQIEEVAAPRIAVDGVMTDAEAYILTEIAALSPTGDYLVYRAAGQNFNDAKLVLQVPPDDRWRAAVQGGTVNGLDKLRQRWTTGRG